MAILQPYCIIFSDDSHRMSNRSGEYSQKEYTVKNNARTRYFHIKNSFSFKNNQLVNQSSFPNTPWQKFQLYFVKFSDV